MYLCVSGIDKQQTNETFFNYIEAKSKGDVNYDESLRTVDKPEHAIVVFEDKIDIKRLKVECGKRALGNSSLEFDEIDPPRTIIASSVDELTVSDFKDYLTKKKKQEVVRVHTTEDGSFIAKFKNTSGVTEILKDTNIKINGSKVVISVMYSCDHGAFWEHSLHRVAIPIPFKPSVSDIHIRSFIIDITSVCNEQLEQHDACLTFKDELLIECTIDPKGRTARQKVKDWKHNVLKAWEEFVNNSVKKRELKITSDTKDSLLEHINKTKDQHKSEELKVISPDETGSMKFVFVGRSKIVENYVEQIFAKKLKIEEELNKKKKIRTGSMKLKPIEIALMTKEDKFGEVNNIAQDFSCEPNMETGTITFIGVEEDISKAKVMIFEIKNYYHSWRIDSLSGHMCQLLKRKPVSDIVNKSFSYDNISIVWDISDNHVTVCTSQDNRRHIEKVFTDTILEDEIKLDKASQDVLMLDEWAEKKTSINNIHRDTAYIDDSYNDRVIVTATSDVFDGIMKELDIFITENSIKEEEIKIGEEEKFKFFKNHCKDLVKELEVKYSDQKLEIYFGRQSIRICGTSKAVDRADGEIKNHLRKINIENHVISEPGVDSLVSDQAESDALVSPVEEEAKTDVTADPNTVNKQTFPRNTGFKKPDDAGPKVETKRPGSSKKTPGKMYLCVSGIDKQQTNETFFNYIEAKSKGDVNYDESLRTVDKPEHAIVVFEDKIDIERLKVECRKIRALGNSSLEFEEIDPPRNIIASSVDKLTVSDFKDYLTKKKKQQVVRVHTTDDESITAKFKHTSGVTEILKDTNIKINGSKVVISVMYSCDHGAFWEHRLHRVFIPDPFKPPVSDSHIRSFITDITSVCNEQLEQHDACLTFKDELLIECTIDPKDRMARQKVKDWKNNVQKAWEEFVNNSVKKRELQITSDTKDSLLEHINKTKDQHKSEELKVISPDETGSMKFVFVGRPKIVENFVEQISAKKLKIEEELNKKKKIRTGSMKLKPIEIALMTKEDKFEEVKNIALDFSCEPNTETGIITFTGVEEDISKAKVMIYEIKNNYHSWRIDSLSGHMCQLLRKKPVSDIVNEIFNDDDIIIVWDISDNHVTVCTSQDNRRHIEKVFTDTILEDEIKLDKASQDVLMLDEWAEKKTSINNIHRDTANIDDSYNDRVIVTATSDVFDGIMKELDIFILENSIKEEEIKIGEEEKFKFFKNHCKDWVKELVVKYSDQKLEVYFGRQSIKICGTPKAVDRADGEIKNHLRNINIENHVISEPGVDSLVSDQAQIDMKPPNAGPAVCKNGTKVILVKKEDLGKQKADVVICSTNGQFDLSGPAGRSIINAAGPEILGEIKTKYSDGIEHGDIAAVSGYKMTCKKVYLAALPGWSSGGEKIIAKCVSTCLLQASKYKSIVFPALGTGQLRYPRHLVAETMYKCVSQFDQSNTSLKEVKFLCNDDETIRAFEQEELRQVNPSFQPQPEKNIQLPWLVDAVEFQHMLSNGEFLSFENCVSLCGPSKAGKSTLASLLIGEDIPLTWNSTNGLVIYFGRNGIDMKEKKMVPLKGGEKGHPVFSKILRGNPGVHKNYSEDLSSKKQHTSFALSTEARMSTKESTTKESQRCFDSGEHLNEVGSRDLDSGIYSIESSEGHPRTQNVSHGMEELPKDDSDTLKLQADILDEVKNGQYRKDVAPSDLIDFGGQKSYDMTHQLFIQHGGSFVLLFDARFGLHNNLQEYPQGDINAASILKHWVDSILTYTEDSGDIMPMIVFAATHRDMCNQNKITKLKEDFTLEIRQMFSGHEKKNHIFLDTVYFISSIDTQDSEIQSMTNQLVSFAMKQSSWGQRRPMAWVPLETQIDLLKTQGVTIITKTQLEQINSLNEELTLTETGLKYFLLIQHSLGKLKYYNLPGLDQFIVIYPPALVSILASFITDEIFWPKKPDLRIILQTMTETGKISKKDLFKIWEQNHFQQFFRDDETKEFVITLLIHLDILIIPKGFKQKSMSEIYLVPCTVKASPPPNFFDSSDQREQTISLAYSLSLHSIPTALAYKAVSSVASVWPLQEISGKLCLYHKAAFFHADENDLRIYLDDNRIMVHLTNRSSNLLSISPDVAASIQECLTMNLNSSLLFYYNMCGRKHNKMEDFFKIEVGLPCKDAVCFQTMFEANKVSDWVCLNGKKHKTKYLRYWSFDRKQEECPTDCLGLDAKELQAVPSNKHLIRLSSQFHIQSFKAYILNLGLKEKDYENISQQYETNGPESVMFMALIKWRDTQLYHCTLQQLHDALLEVAIDCHRICQISRKDTALLDIAEGSLLCSPKDDVLLNLSHNVGNCTIQLGIELGLEIDAILETMYRYPRDMHQQNLDILKKWKETCTKPTVLSLMQALKCVQSGGLQFMMKKYHIAS